MTAMRISEIHIYRKDLPIVGGPYTMSRITLHSVDTTIVKLVADSGLTGWGERRARRAGARSSRPVRAGAVTAAPTHGWPVEWP